MRKKPYPKEEGWIKIEAVLTSEKPLSEDRIKHLITQGHPDDYEFGPVSQNGSRVRSVVRVKR